MQPALLPRRSFKSPEEGMSCTASTSPFSFRRTTDISLVLARIPYGLTTILILCRLLPYTDIPNKIDSDLHGSKMRAFKQIMGFGGYIIAYFCRGY